jgi:hypothetical protein
MERVTELELGGLSRDEGVALAKSLVPTLELAAAERAWENAHGLPFWLEALALKRARDTFSKQRRRFSVAALAHLALELGPVDAVGAVGPRAVASTVLLRLARLPGEAADVTRAVSVLGESAELPTVAALAELDVGLVVPGHCTGWKAAQRLAEGLPGAFAASSVGTIFRF